MNIKFAVSSLILANLQRVGAGLSTVSAIDVHNVYCCCPFKIKQSFLHLFSNLINMFAYRISFFFKLDFH